MSDRIEQIKARLAAATPGPWNIYRYKHGGGRICIDDEEQVGRRRELIADTIGDDPEAVATIYNEGDREFLVNTPADLAYLLAENARLQGVIEAALAEDARLFPDRLEGGTRMYRILTATPEQTGDTRP